MTPSRWDHFFVEELACRCGCGRMEMDHGFMHTVVMMRVAADFPFPVSSGFRCPDYNARISTTGRHGPHTWGQALDIMVPSHRLFDFWRLAYEFGMTGHGHGENRGFCHIDNLTGDDDPRFAVRPNAWSY